MYYIYVLDHTFHNIYEIATDKEEIGDLNNTKIEQLLYKYYHLDAEYTNYMITDHKLEIRRLGKK